MNITFRNNCNRFTFTDSWCSGDKTPMIHYDIKSSVLFNVVKIELTKEERAVKRIITKKKLFRSITEEVEENIVEIFIYIEYLPNSYENAIKNIKIAVESEEISKATEVVTYISSLLAEKKQKEHDEKKQKENELNKIIQQEQARLKQCEHDLVVIDFETTGIKSPMETFITGGKYDEILSVSIIDQDGNILLNSLCRPELRKSWSKAQEIHGISPAMVKDKPTFAELFPLVKEILLKSKIVIAYNIDFERQFLYGFDAEFDFPGDKKIREQIVWGPDPMLMYCAYRGNEKWQKLSTVAKHFNFSYEAHDSLEDIKATLYCYKRILEYVKSTSDKEYIIKYGFLYEDDRKGEWIDVYSYNIEDVSKIR